MFNLNTKFIQWKFMQLIQKLIQSKNGTIFGGYVRDKIIHDYYATQYYKKCSYTDKNIKYNNPNYIPETKLRMIIPHDIDCFMSTQDFKEFKESLSSNMISYNESISNNLYIHKVNNPNLKHSKLKITFMMNSLMKSFINVNAYAIYVDVIYSDSIIEVEPPFGTIDFECNALLLTKSNDYQISNVLINVLNLSDPMKKLNKLNEIISDILEMKTTIVTSTIQNYRINHMLNKKWTLLSQNIVLTASHKIDDDLCYICLNNLCKSKSKYKCKFNCCKAYIHEHCMDQLIQKNKCDICPWCKKSKMITISDLKLITAIN
jgi:hypothetical protein